MNLTIQQLGNQKMRRRILQTTFLIILSQILFSTDLIEVFKKEIPISFLQQETELNMIRFGLIEKASTDPELIYFYLQYIRLISENTFPDSLILYNNYISVRELETKMRYNDWIQNEVDLIDKAETDYFIKKYVRKVFLTNTKRKNKDEIAIIQTPPMNKNLVDYFVVKLYKLDSEMDYDKNIDYSTERKTLEEMTEQKIRGYLVNLGSIQKTHKSSDFKSLFENWFLFTQDDDINDINPYNYIINAYESSLTSDRDIHLQLNLFTSHLKSSLRFKYNISSPEDDRFSITKKLTSSNTYGYYGFSFKFRYWLKDFVTPLSYLTFETSLSVGSNFEDSYVGPFDYWIKGEIGSSYFERISFWSIDVSIQDVYSLELKTTMPVFFKPNLLTIETGINFLYQKVKINHTADYYWSIRYSYIEETPWGSYLYWYVDRWDSGLLEESINTDNIEILPVIDVIFETPLKHINITMSLSPGHVATKIGYEF